MTILEALFSGMSFFADLTKKDMPLNLPPKEVSSVVSPFPIRALRRIQYPLPIVDLLDAIAIIIAGG